jgi:hypothetical protein
VKSKKPTDAELAKTCNMTQESYAIMKGMTLDELVAFGTLFGCHVHIALTENKYAKKKIKIRK